MNQDIDTKSPADTTYVRDAARHLYESSDLSLAAVAAEFGVSDRSVKRWAAADGGWSKLSGPEITARAQAVADKIKTSVTDLGPAAGEEDRQAATAALRTESAIDQRAAILAKHRQEWSVVRDLVAEAVRSRDGAKAKLAVDVGRALDLAQRGEARAWGLEAGEVQGCVTVVIERT